jgi:8-oxo-dGTP pyrophosphatase MutT (NUDIX family)
MKVVHAAGGVVWRRTDGRIEVVLVHRPHYDDWTFPKGKRKDGETDEACALREVREETGLRCSLGQELPTIEYVDSRDRPKIVRWWMMQPLDGRFEIDEDEVDEARWVSTYEASHLLTYDRDRRLLDAFASVAA